MASALTADTEGRGVDRGLALPAWAQVAGDLRKTIARGMETGDRLPSENELTKVYGVSRITIRQALSALEEEGAIERRQGRGTFVAETNPHVSHDLAISEPWRTRFQREGHTAGSTQLATTFGGPASVRKALGVSREAVVPRLRRVHIVDGVPIGMVDSWVSEAMLPGIAEEPLLGGSLTDTMRERYGIAFSKAEGWMSIGEMSSEEAELLQCPPGTSAFIVDEELRDSENRLVAVSVTKWRSSGVRFRFATVF